MDFTNEMYYDFYYSIICILVLLRIKDVLLSFPNIKIYYIIVEYKIFFSRKQLIFLFYNSNNVIYNIITIGIATIVAIYINN